jgi:hypothetical protein
MADKKISQDTSLTASQTRAAVTSMYVPVVDPNETLVANRNKRITYDQVGQLYAKFTALSGTTWDGSNKTKTLTANLALTFSPGSNLIGQLIVKQDATGSRTLSINGTSITINTAANSRTIVSVIFIDSTNEYIFMTGSPVLAIAGTADTTPPTVSSRATGSTTTIVITFSEAVNITSTTGWSFKKNGSALAISSVSGSGTNVLTFVVATMAGGDTLLASYNSGTGNTADLAANPLASFTDQSVTNGIGGDTTPPTLVSITIQNASPDKIDILFNEALGSSNPVNGDFVVLKNGSADGLLGSPFVSGSTVQLTLAIAAINTDVYTVSYTAGTNPIQDVAGNNAANFTNHAVTNNVGGGTNSMQSYIDAVVAAGGSFTSPQQTALATFKDNLVTAGVWSKIHQMVLLRNGSFARCAPNMKSPGTKDLGSTNGGITYGANGVIGNGTTGYIDTGLTPSTEFTNSNIFLAVYSRTAGSTEVSFDTGAATTSPNVQDMLTSGWGTARTRIDNADGANQLDVTTDSQGFFIASRTSNTLLTLYKNGSSIGTNTVDTTNLGLPCHPFLHLCLQ